MQVDLPHEIRWLLKQAATSISARNFRIPEEDEESGMGVQRDVMETLPLLELVCTSILIPLLQDEDYVSKRTFLGKSVLAVRDPTVRFNLESIAKFLEQMFSKSWISKEQSRLEAVVEPIQQKLLAYIKRQIDVSDAQYKIHTLKDVYITHFDRNKHYVSMLTKDLMGLSNMLTNYRKEINMSEKDSVAMLCKDIPFWNPSEVKRNRYHNFVMNSRFLFGDGRWGSGLGYCSLSGCVMPPNLGGTGQIIRIYKDEDEKNPRKSLEALFFEIDTITSKDFKDMKKDLEKSLSICKMKSSQYAARIRRLQDGLHTIDELIFQQAFPLDVIKFMEKSLDDRATHRKYMSLVGEALTDIEIAHVKYNEKISKWKAELAGAVKMSVNRSLPEKLTTVSSEPLTLEQISKKARGAMNRNDYPEGCVFSPTATYSFQKLKKMNVVTEIHPPYNNMQKNMKITVQTASGGGVDITAFVLSAGSQNTLKRLEVSKETLLGMKRAESTETGVLGEPPFLTYNLTNFLHLINELLKKGA